MFFKEKLREILTVNEPPRKVAAAFALGIFIGMSPLLGIHTLLGIFLAWQLRLNKLVTLVGVYVTNPWTIVPIYTFGTWVGAKMLGVEQVIPTMDWHHMSLKILLVEFEHLLMPFIVGSTVNGAIAALIAYVVIYQSVKRNRG
ncbi:MAG: DUF2062 domain-containing protein [Nitrospiraceae bacterium]|nr:DUF2062 domain-containing protein [Nitrospiraceae bacterium]